MTVRKFWKTYTAVALSFLFGFAWATYIGYKDVSQFGTQLQCQQQGDIQK